MDTGVYSARSPAQIKQLLEEYGTLTESELSASASRWGKKHLPHYRLIVEDERKVLSTFTKDHEFACPVCCSPENALQRLRPDMVASLLQDRSPGSLSTSRGSDLFDLPGGYFWSSLEQTYNPADANVTISYTGRERRTVRRSPYTDTIAAVDGSSSPVPPSTSDFSAAYSFDDDINENIREVTEDQAAHLSYNTDCYYLQCIEQDDPDMEFRARLKRIRTVARVGAADMTSIDDGGLATCERLPHKWATDNPFATIREAKKAFTGLIELQNGDLVPEVTNNTLAQYLGEAIIAVRGNPEHLQRDVFLQAQSNTFRCLVHYHFGSKYHAYLDATTDADRESLVKQYPNETCIYMRRTRLFDMMKSAHRGSDFCNFLSLLRWIRNNRRPSKEADHGVDSDEEMPST